MIKISLGGKVLLQLKDILFILACIVMFLFIADAFAEDRRIASYFIAVLTILEIIYALKVIDNYNMQETKQTDQSSKLESGSKTARVTKPRFFEAQIS